ncbi:MAG: ABC transporter substrate-binding protein [Alphaproteobacteria bacterium]
MRKMKMTIAALGLTALGVGYAQAEAVLKIGVLGSYGGFAGSEVSGEGAALAARQAVEDFGGKVAGMKIEVVAADMQNKPDVAATIARKWFDQDGVDMITDLPVTPVALAVQAIAKERKKVTVVAAAVIADLTGKACSPYSIHWAEDSIALSKSAKLIVETGGKTWFFVVADFGFGHAMLKDATAAIEAAGGKVLGSIKHPLGAGDFASYLLAAQNSKAQVIGFANVATDLTNGIKQASEFGLVAAGQRLAGTVVFISDINGLGLQKAQGLLVTSSFYWDKNEATRAFGRKYFAKLNRMPTKVQGSVYSGVLHYLKAVQAAGTKDAAAVTTKMKSMPVDWYGEQVKIREDGRLMQDVHLYQVKSPAESKYAWDYYKLVKTMKADEAFKPLSQSECDFIKK